MNFKGYVYNVNNSDVWTSSIYESMDDCIIDAIDDALDYNKPTFLIGKAYDLGFPGIDVESMIERLQDQAIDMYGESGEEYLFDITKDLEDQLSDKLECAFEEFCQENGISREVNAYTIEDEVEYKYCAFCKRLMNEDESYVKCDMPSSHTDEDHYYFHSECENVPITHLVLNHRKIDSIEVEETTIEEY